MWIFRVPNGLTAHETDASAPEQKVPHVLEVSELPKMGKIIWKTEAFPLEHWIVQTEAWGFG